MPGMSCYKGMVVCALVTCLLVNVAKGFEHTCADDHLLHLTTLQRSCRENVAAILSQSACNQTRRRRSVLNHFTQKASPFMSAMKASEFLRVKKSVRPSRGQGHVCECCLHRCTLQEINEYKCED